MNPKAPEKPWGFLLNGSSENEGKKWSNDESQDTQRRRGMGPAVEGMVGVALARD
jgi:hypothetical protein